MKYHCPTCGVDHNGNGIDGIPQKFCCKEHYNRFKNLKTRYRLTPKGVAALFLKQKGRCKICGTIGHTQEIGNPKLPLLFIDHCHTTKRVRGLLCHNCNTALGHLKDTPSITLKAFRYLSHFPCKDFLYSMKLEVLQFIYNPIGMLLRNFRTLKGF